LTGQPGRSLPGKLDQCGNLQKKGVAMIRQTIRLAPDYARKAVKNRVGFGE
jgi:hypothetical protein